MASGPSRRHDPSVAERAVGSRLRHHDQAALRPPGGGGGELQPEEAGPSLACLPRVPDGGHAAGSGCRCCAGQPSPLDARGAVPVGLAGPSRPGSLAAPGAGRQGLGQRGQHGVVRGGGSGLFVQAAPDQGGAPACRAADGAGRLGGCGPGLAGDRGRAAPAGLEPVAPGDGAAPPASRAAGADAPR